MVVQVVHLIIIQYIELTPRNTRKNEVERGMYISTMRILSFKVQARIPSHDQTSLIRLLQ
jgi:hypothetical protein